MKNPEELKAKTRAVFQHVLDEIKSANSLEDVDRMQAEAGEMLDSLSQEFCEEILTYAESRWPGEIRERNARELRSFMEPRVPRHGH